MKIQLTAVYEKGPCGYIGYVEELPGANTQGATLQETKANLLEAIELVLVAHKQMAEEEIPGKECIRETIGVLTA
jgi:predicted RNase H-like HicB family nuclease